MSSLCPINKDGIGIVKRTLPSQLWLGTKNVIKAFNGFIIYNEHDIYYFDSLPAGQQMSYTYKKKVDVKILDLTYLPTLSVVILLFENHKRLQCVALGKDLEIFSIRRQYASAPPRKSYLTHNVTSKNSICVYSYHNDTLLFTSVNTKSQYCTKILLSGFDVYILGKRGNLEPYASICTLTYSNKWKLIEKKSISNLAKYLGVFDCDALSCSRRYLICSSFDKIYIADLKSPDNVSVVKASSIVTTFSWISERTALITTDSYDILFLSIDSLKLKRLPIQPLSFGVENVIVMDAYAFLTSDLAGFYVLDTKHPLHVGYIRSTTYVPLKEINLFLGVSHAFRNDSGETFISYTDGYNTVLTKRSLGFRIRDMEPDLRKKETFLGYYAKDSFFTRDGDGQLYINGNTPFRGGELRGTKIQVTCFQIYDNFVAIYDEHTKTIHVFPGDENFQISVDFVPDSIRIHKCDAFSIELLLFNHLNLSLYIKQCAKPSKLVSHIKWENSDPILDVDFSDSFENLYVRTFSESVWKVVVPENKFVLISENQHFSRIFSLGDHLLGLAQGKIYCIDNNSARINKIVRNFAGEILHCSKVSNSYIVITTTTEIIEITSEEIYDIETPLLGVTVSSLVYNSSLRLVYTTHGLYMIDMNSLDIQAAFLIPNITDVKVDRVIKKVIVAVWNVEQKNRNAIIFSIFYNEILSKFKIEKQLSKDHIENSVLIEPTNGVVSFSGHLYDYRGSTFFDRPVDVLHHVPRYGLQYLSDRKCYAYITNDSMLILTKIGMGSISKWGKVTSFYVQDGNNLVLSDGRRLLKLPLGSLTHIDGSFGPSDELAISKNDSSIHWINTSLLLTNESLKKWGYKEGIVSISISSSAYEEYEIMEKRSAMRENDKKNADILKLQNFA